MNKNSTDELQNDAIVGEPVACAVCGSEDGELLFRGPDRLTGKSGTFQLVRCGQCGVLRQSPRPSWDVLQTYYPDESYAAYEQRDLATLPGWQQWLQRYGLRRRLRAVEKVQAGGKLLDVGCGTGGFLAEAQQNGRWQVEGLEPNPYAAGYVRRRLSIPVRTTTFPANGLPANAYHVVTMWNVLEHLPQPRQSLRAARDLLKPGGWLIFSVPNVESLEARLAGPYWVGWDLPRHLYLFPRRQLQQLLAECGFTVSHMRCLSTSYHALGMTLSFWAQDAQRRDTPGPQRLVRVYHHPLMRVLLTPGLWLLDQLQLSSFLTVFAQCRE